MKEMISVAQADKIISDSLKSFKPVKQPLLKSYRCMLQENIKADRDLPAFDKALMDGIAIKSADYKKGQRKFLIEGVQAAGVAKLKLKFPHSCTEIMTGAVVTEGCDCIIPIEDVQITEGKARVQEGLKITKYQHIRKQGADHKKGSILLEKGFVLNPPQIAVAASVGKAEVKVAYKPRVALISSGDELVDIDQPIKPYQIRRANSYFMQAALEKTGLFYASTFHFPDDRRVLLRQIRALMENFDVLVFTGGISKGKYDYIPQVLSELGSRCLFYRVKQKPGKPFWFGQTKQKKLIFALPGNPVATQMGMYRYVLKYLKKAIGFQCPDETATLRKSFKPNTTFTNFLPVRLSQDASGRWMGMPVPFSGSGDFGSLARSDGFMELPAGGKTVKAGFKGKLFRW